MLQPFITLYDTLIGFFHGISGDWGAAVIMLTLLIRALSFPLQLAAVRQQFRQAAMRPQLEELRSRFAGNAQALMRGMADLNRKFGVRPFVLMGASVLQLPVFMSLYPYFAAHGGEMTSALIPWLQTLGSADTLHVLPLLYGLLTGIGMMIPPVPEAAVQPAGMRLAIAAVVAVIPLVIMWRSPAALVLYWAASGVVTIAERLFFRTGPGRRWAAKGLPETETGIVQG